MSQHNRLNSLMNHKTYMNFNQLLNSNKIIKINEEKNHIKSNSNTKITFSKKNKKETNVERKMSFDSNIVYPKNLEMSNKPLNSNILPSIKIRKSLQKSFFADASLPKKENISNNLNIITNGNTPKERKLTYDTSPTETIDERNNSPIMGRRVTIDCPFSNSSSPKKKGNFVSQTFKKSLEKFMENSFPKTRETENDDVYLNSSSREMINSPEKIQTYLEIEREFENLPKHKEIIETLFKINNSDFLLVNDLTFPDKIYSNRIEKCKKMNHLPKNLFPNDSVNQIMSPNAKLFEHFFSPTYEIETKTNRYNVKNKRITLNGSTNHADIDEHLKFYTERNKLTNNTQIIMNNTKKNNQKKYYNNWYLPVKLWNIQKKPFQKQVFTDSEYFYKNLHEGSLTNLKQSNPFIKPLNNAYKSRLDLLKEKFRNNVFVGNYKKMLENKKVRVPAFLKDVTIRKFS